MFEQNKNLIHKKTDEVQSIIEKMPSNFAFCVTSIVLLIFIVISLCGFYVKYPDIISGQITLNTNSIPIKLVSNSTGRLMLNGIKSLDEVKEGQIICHIQNNCDFKHVLFLDSILMVHNPASDNILKLLKILPHNLNLGELTGDYYTFLSTLQELESFRNDNSFDEQTEYYNKLITERSISLKIGEERKALSRENLKYVRNFFIRDSILIAKKVISESDFDNIKMSYVSSKDAYQGILNNNSSVKQAIQEAQSSMVQIGLNKKFRYRELKLSLVSAYYKLNEGIRAWQFKYIIKSPYSGKVQFLKFWSDNQFVNSGDALFSILHDNDKLSGQVMLPVAGSGKVKIGQKVIIKLQKFPYDEYGSITAKVRSIALNGSETKTNQGDIDTYMISLDFPNGLRTNYGQNLNLGYEAKGTAEVITNDRVLIERLFENIKYLTHL